MRVCSHRNDLKNYVGFLLDQQPFFMVQQCDNFNLENEPKNALKKANFDTVY